MSYSMIAIIFFATIALSLSVPVFDNERNVLIRFYSDFAQVYRPVGLKSYVDDEHTLEQYQFYFTEKEYLRIPEESLAMLYTNVIERTITFYPTPNFVVNGSRYLYRPNPSQNFTVEIELVNPQALLFREVDQPNHYFYLPSFNDLVYVNQVPVLPYYEVTFVCNTSSPQTETPLLSYIDQGFRYSTRYLLDLPSVGNSKQVELQAFADIHYTGEQPFVIKGAELLAGDINLNTAPVDNFRTGSLYQPNVNNVTFVNYIIDPSVTQTLGVNASGTYVYQLSLPTPLTFLGRSLKSIRFLKSNVTVKSFLYYSSVFLPVNVNGKVVSAFNLTSVDNYLPNGHLITREQGRYLGQIDLPNLPIGETFTIVNEPDAEVSYRRQVTAIFHDEENNDSVTYYVEYTFENFKSSRDFQVYFVESFSSFTNFQIQNLSISTSNQDLPYVELVGTDLRGYVFVPQQDSPIVLSYNLIVYKN